RASRALASAAAPSRLSSHPFLPSLAPPPSAEARQTHPRAGARALPVAAAGSLGGRRRRHRNEEHAPDEAAEPVDEDDDREREKQAAEQQIVAEELDVPEEIEADAAGADEPHDRRGADVVLEHEEQQRDDPVRRLGENRILRELRAAAPDAAHGLDNLRVDAVEGLVQELAEVTEGIQGNRERSRRRS